MHLIPLYVIICEGINFGGVTMKNVLITGGTRGIGASCVRLFTKKGYRTFIIYQKNDELADKLCKETGCIAYRADICDKDKLSDVVNSICTKHGGIDVLINNAGIAEQMLFIDITPEQWKKMLDVNLTGIYNVTQEVTKHMLTKGGSIINISSIWGEHGASCEVHYSAAKAGIIGFTKALAKELGLMGIRVNCIAPGIIETDMNSHLTDEDIADICSQIPISRVGTPDECAELAYFLASDNSSYITGQTIGINGGWEM